MNDYSEETAGLQEEVAFLEGRLEGYEDLIRMIRRTIWAPPLDAYPKTAREHELALRFIADLVGKEDKK